MPRKKRKAPASGKPRARGQGKAGATRAAAVAGRKPVSALLARRLAGAASGFPNGKNVWFYARYDRKNLSFDVSDPIVSDTAPADPTDPDFGLFGPYQTPAIPSRRPAVARVTIELVDGRRVTLPIEKADTLFLSPSALEKFAIPYYAALGDLELAMKIRRTFEDDNVVLLCHGPNTEYCFRETKDFAR